MRSILTSVLARVNRRGEETDLLRRQCAKLSNATIVSRRNALRSASERDSAFKCVNTRSDSWTVKREGA